ncbi:MAG: tetratricopeptide repeat protein [Spirochaetaceae bacterium]|jgi:tetratricopeptide (TPR) repeat protein|nr:tetratricopeptide repeat protein [Spirochaetaceae bacterium]
MKNRKFLISLCVVCFAGLAQSCVSSAASAEEYYSIGMAYYEIGKYEEAEKWLAKASSVKKTMHASEYNLGRILYENGHYNDALKHFERVLKSDSNNVMALKAAAYTEIMLDNLEKADLYYSRVLQIEPESADDGYNHALVLYAMKKYPEAEAVLDKFSYNIPENKNTLLLLARAQHMQKKIQAIDTYTTWLLKNKDPLVSYEYALVLEEAGYYARAMETLREALAEMKDDTASLKKATVRFELAKLLLIADPENEAGIIELKGAVTDGFSEIDALETLMENDRVIKTNKTEIQDVISELKSKVAFNP